MNVRTHPGARLLGLVAGVLVLVAATGATVLAATSPGPTGARPQQQGVTLVFSQQPSSTKPNLAIRPIVTVTALDSDGVQIGDYSGHITLSATNAVGTVKPGVLSGNVADAVEGFAQFPNLKVSQVGQNYRLTARDNFGNTSSPSNPFNVVQTLFSCPAGQTCTGVAAGGGTQTTLTVGPFAKAVKVGIGVGGFPRLTCQKKSDPVTSFVVGDTTKSKSLKYLIRRSVEPNPLTICFGAPVGFSTKPGTPLRSAHGQFEGLLPNCPPQQRTGPCIVSRTKIGVDTSFQLFLPAGPTDPRVAY